MADVTERMLALLATLQTGGTFAGPELAERIGTSPRTLRRDVDRLRGYGYPVLTRPGPGGYYRLAAGRTMPPLVLDDDEAVATLLGLAFLGSIGPAQEGGLDEAATRAYGKIDQFLPRRLRPRVTSIRGSVETSRQPGPQVAADLLGRLGEAIGAHDVVTFDYRRAGGTTDQRRVQPHRLVHHLLRWYLLGWDVDRDDWRTFRLDRLDDLRTTGEPFAPRPLPADSAIDHLRHGMHQNSQQVELVVRAPLATVADEFRLQDAELQAVDEEHTSVVLQVESWPWLLLHLALLDVEFTMRAPEAFVRACGAFADQLATAMSVREG